MDNFIALSIKEDDENETISRTWYRCVKEALADGLLDTFSVGDGNAVMKRKVTQGRTIFTIKLVRNVTEREVKAVEQRVSAYVDCDYTVMSSVVEMNVDSEIEVEVDKTMAEELCMKWAKEEHDKWMKKAIDNGWQYGVKLDQKEKRNPLIRPFHELPEKYKKADTKRLEEFMKLINDSGYLIVRKSDLSK